VSHENLVPNFKIQISDVVLLLLIVVKGRCRSRLEDMHAILDLVLLIVSDIRRERDDKLATESLID
jgi:hypothetical protein